MLLVTGAPIKFLGAGEKLDALEAFHPARRRRPHSRHGRCRQPGGKAAETLDKDEAEKIAAKMKKGSFEYERPASQLNQMKKLGGMKGVLGMLPGVGKIKSVGRRRHRRQDSHPPGSHHLLHDKKRTG